MALAWSVSGNYTTNKLLLQPKLPAKLRGSSSIIPKHAGCIFQCLSIYIRRSWIAQQGKYNHWNHVYLQLPSVNWKCFWKRAYSVLRDLTFLVIDYTWKQIIRKLNKEVTLSFPFQWNHLVGFCLPCFVI